MANPIVIEGKKIGRLRASGLLFKETWRFLMTDKELVLIPIVTFFVTLLLLGVVTILTFIATGGFKFLERGDSLASLPQVILGIAFYITVAFVAALSQAAVSHIVFTRAHGGNANLHQGFSSALAKTPQLLLWAAITSTVGLVLKTISDRSRIIASIVAYLLGAAWSIMTFFVVPVIMFDKKGVFESIPYSATLFKKTWGETIVSNISIGLVFFLAYIVAIILFLALVFQGLTLNNPALIIVAVVFGFIWIIVCSILQTVMQAVLRTLLYIYAADNSVPSNFNRELLENVMQRKSVLPSYATSTPAPAMGEVVPEANNQNNPN